MPQPPTGTYRRITGKGGAGKDNKQDDGDTQIGFVDGRAEKLRLNLDRSINELQPRVDLLTKISLLDTEEYLGSGEKFKKDIKTLKADSKSVGTACKGILDRISKSAQPNLLQTEKERSETMSNIAETVHTLCQTMLETTVPFESLSDSMNGATTAKISLSPTFYAVRIWKHVESLVSVDKPQEALETLKAGSNAVVSLEKSLA